MTNVTPIKPTKGEASKVTLLTNRCALDNPDFVYTPAATTDIRVRFEAIRAAQAKAAAKQLKKAATK